jgi:hypothetical protein
MNEEQRDLKEKRKDLKRIHQEGYLDGLVSIVYKDPKWTPEQVEAYNKGQSDACRERGLK